jgi:hypothetical protein
VAKKKEHVPQDVSNYWEQLERLEKLIKASELKAGVIFSFHSLIIGLFVERLDFFQTLFNDSIVFIILTVFWISFVLTSIYYCFRCFMPRLELKYDKNVFFFRDAVYSFGNVEEYSLKLMHVVGNEAELCSQLSQQVHIESKVVDKKFGSVKKSIRFFAFSFITVILLIIFWVLKWGTTINTIG